MVVVGASPQQLFAAQSSFLLRFCIESFEVIGSQSASVQISHVRQHPNSLQGSAGLRLLHHEVAVRAQFEQSAVVVVGAAVVGATVVGPTVVGVAVVGVAVVGVAVVGATVVGATVVGATVVGPTVVGVSGQQPLIEQDNCLELKLICPSAPGINGPQLSP